MTGMSPERLAEIEALDGFPATYIYVKVIPELLAEVRRLQAQRDAALALHSKATDPHGNEMCAECVDPWPCRTRGALGVDRG